MMKIVKIILFILLCILTSITIPPAGVIFSYMALRENKESIRRFIVKISPDTEKIIPALIKRYNDPKTIISLVIFSIATIGGLILLISHLHIQETDDYVNYILEQVALTGILVVGVSGIAWVLFSLNSVFASLLAKVGVSLAVSACVIFSRLSAVDFFAANFPFPPSYLPFSFGLATLIFAFSFSAFAYAVLAIIFEVIFLLFLFIFDFKTNKKTTYFLFAISLAGFIGSYSAAQAMIQGISNKGPLFMIKAAERYDFTTNHMCQVQEGETVLFIDNVADRAIAATFPPPPQSEKISPRNISDATLKSYLPTHFRTVRCNQLAEAQKEAGWCGSPQRYGYCDADGKLRK